MDRPPTPEFFYDLNNLQEGFHIHPLGTNLYRKINVVNLTDEGTRQLLPYLSAGRIDSRILIEPSSTPHKKTRQQRDVGTICFLACSTYNPNCAIRE